MPPVTVGALQLKVVPAGTILPEPFDGVMLKFSALQTAVDKFKINGRGLTETVTVKFAPTQAPVVPEIGVTI